MQDLKERFSKLKEKNDENNSRKIRFEEKLKAATKNLKEVLEEIKGLGIDPKNISKVIEEKKKDLENKVSSLEEEIEEVSNKLDEIEESV
jgi:predicted  nucleic acid-binding Zn-ribbon protein